MLALLLSLNIVIPSDSVYLFSYTSKHEGLQFAWSRDSLHWNIIGQDHPFLRCDYGTWGAEKKMYAPYLLYGRDSLWHCIWSLNAKDAAFAHAASADLVHWKRQSYPTVKEGNNVLNPILHYNNKSENYEISYNSSDNKIHSIATKDFKSYTPISSANPANNNTSVELPTGKTAGQIHRLAWPAVEQLINTYNIRQHAISQNNETTKQDAVRFADLKNISATISVYPEKAKPISDLLLGIFFEDINYAADGGLYAELIQNRDFEYTSADKHNWHAGYAWEFNRCRLDSVQPVHPNNPHYVILEKDATLTNTGFDGIAVKKNEKYAFSLFAKGKGKLQVQLVDNDNKVVADGILNISSDNWKNIQTTLTARTDNDSTKLLIKQLSTDLLSVDMISLFPPTFKNRKNGLRADLAQSIADIHPRFVRFPGGCVAHGNGLENMYRWKNTIGPLASRKPQRNIWGYHQSAGLGYFEYFQFCEDIGAIPLPVVAAGVPCQNSSIGGAGQQGGIPLNEMKAYVQEILDLIEYANGDIHTTWGKKRAEAGHPAPFNLRYIGIGNEDLITDIFEERFRMLYDAMKTKHPEITVIGTVGPFCEGTDYEEGWALAKDMQLPVVDEHYYQPVGWFINNQSFYDKYDRNLSKVYLGEYAAHLPNRATNLETALAEAIYLTSLERNGDIVQMASYAPLLAREGHTQWNPDLIYFNNTSVKPTVGYYVQQLFGANAGDTYLPAEIKIEGSTEAVRNRVAISVVKDTKSNDMILKMVNLLPVSVQLNSTIVTTGKGTKTVLQGKPDARDVKPVAQEYDGDTTLPPYSFTVIRLHSK